MDKEQEHIDTDPVDSSELESIQGLGSNRVIFEGEIVHMDLYSRKESGESVKVVADVEMEYTPFDKNLSRDSIQRYLDTYSSATLTPERAARMIHQDMSDELDLDHSDELYVQLKYKEVRSSKMVIHGTVI